MMKRLNAVRTEGSAGALAVDDVEATPERAGRRGPAAWAAVWRRWPAALAVAAAGLMWGVDTVGGAQILLLLPMLYVVVAAVGRPLVVWPALLAGTGLVFALHLQNRIDVATALLVVAAAVGGAGLLRRAGRAETAVQLVGLLVFGGVAVLALHTGPELARVLVAAGWLSHGLWDLLHLRRRGVVPAAYAEWCAVLDVLVGVSLLVTY
ncbi:hypothetical protein QLQ12_27885 [Actinoplanes sp. NEAU-A12]|uniref:Uncharacterized protein n=1 Tax=Actinoplanes sandaracinus TaxID=3045177 RepID=A0ABT6WRS2_9ACTN|nr:hypothetical protein [Actinoplanes sandaracinus]MDI6102446.1 hypothetical protein [Actinoplanes sandaracinus]